MVTSVNSLGESPTERTRRKGDHRLVFRIMRETSQTISVKPDFG